MVQAMVQADCSLAGKTRPLSLDEACKEQNIKNLCGFFVVIEY